MADTIISRLLLTLDTKEFRNGIRQADRELKDWSKGIGKIGDMLGAAFAVGVIADFTMEAVKLGDELTAAQQGFQRFGEAADMEKLRASTGGMVSDLKLMQQAIQAGNFGIPIQELGNLFAFAQQRAKETGQEVDYLTQSIVTGIGRKSPLILDNLGISAVQLREKLGGVSAEAASIAEVTKAVGEIASEELGKMGGTIDDATTKSKQFTANWENFKANVGQTLSPIANGFLTLANAIMTGGAAMNYTAEAAKLANGTYGMYGQVLGKVKDDTAEAVRETLNLGSAMRGVWETFNVGGPVQKSVTTLGGLKEKLTELQKEFQEVDVTTARFKELRLEIERLETRIKALTNPVAGMMPKTETINLVSKGLNEVGTSVAGMQIQVQKAMPSINDLNTTYVDLNKQQAIFNELGGTMGRILSESFNAALINGESFFKTFINGLKQMVAQILATAAAAAALAVALMALGIPGVKGLNFGQTFSGLYKAMGGIGAQSLNLGSTAPGMVGAGAGLIGGAGLGGGRTVLRGNDIFVSNSRTNFDISRIGG